MQFTLINANNIIALPAHNHLVHAWKNVRLFRAELETYSYTLKTIKGNPALGKTRCEERGLGTTESIRPNRPRNI